MQKGSDNLSLSCRESLGGQRQPLCGALTRVPLSPQVLTELKSDNQRLKDENGALIRVISKLSK